MIIQEWKKNDFLLSNDKKRINIDSICEFMRKSYWANNRKPSTIVKSIEHSLCYGIYKNEEQVAFARVVTDYSIFAILCDVFVDERFRGKGLAKWMMSCMMQNPDLRDIRRFLLATKDAHGLYQQFGFRPLSDEEQKRYMTIFRENN